MRDIRDKLKLTYLQYDYEGLIVESDPTISLLRYIYLLSINRIKLADGQISDLLSDISTVKYLNLWDYNREKSTIENLGNRYSFHEQLKKLQDAEIQRYYKNIIDEGVFNIDK